MPLYEVIRNFLLNEGRDIILDFLPQNSCVTSTRICVELLKLYDIEAHPEAVYAVCANPGLTIVGRNPAGVPAEWNGHLVCVVDSEQELIDLSLDQIGLAPISTRFNGEFPFSTSSLGVPLVYFEDPHPQGLGGVFNWEETWKLMWDEILEHKP